MISRILVISSICRAARMSWSKRWSAANSLPPSIALTPQEEEEADDDEADECDIGEAASSDVVVLLALIPSSSLWMAASIAEAHSESASSMTADDEDDDVDEAAAGCFLLNVRCSSSITLSHVTTPNCARARSSAAMLR